MKILVCGGRYFNDYGLVREVLNDYSQSQHLIHGACAGADLLAARYARSAGWTISEFPADWAKHGRSAGPIRNAEMLAQAPDLVIAFPGGRGTADMVKRARAAGVTVREAE